MKNLFKILGLLVSFQAFAEPLPKSYTELLKFIQPSPDQGETNTCWYMASTGAMELLLNKRDKITRPKVNGQNDLAESFLIFQKSYWDAKNPPQHFIEEVVQKFNHGEAIQNKFWPYKAFYEDGTDNFEVWNKHPKFSELPRVQVPQVTTEFLFSRGGRWDTNVLQAEDILSIKKALVKYKSPIIVNYNDDFYWHVILIVGYDDRKKGECYQLEPEECQPKGTFFVRDSDGKRVESRAYSWFLVKGNAAAVVKLK